MAGEMARAHNRALDLFEEADPRTTDELLEDWERVAALPDPCLDAADTQQERRFLLEQKIVSSGGQSPQFFIDVAAALGFTVTITEFKPFQAGRSTASEPLQGEAWWFAWNVNGPAVTVREFRTGVSAAGEPLRDWGNELLECVIARLAPAHTATQFAYG